MLSNSPATNAIVIATVCRAQKADQKFVQGQRRFRVRSARGLRERFAGQFGRVDAEQFGDREKMANDIAQRWHGAGGIGGTEQARDAIVEQPQ